jgi:hypothetical protein
MSRNSILIDPIHNPIVMATVAITNVNYTSITDIVSGISTANLKNGVLLRNYGFGNVTIYNSTSKNRQREINLIPDESIFINLSNIGNIQIKTNSVLGSTIGIVAN